MSESVTSQLANSAGSSDGIQQLIQTETRAVEQFHNEQALEAFTPFEIKDSLKEKLIDGFQVKPEVQEHAEVQHNLDNITNFVYHELGVYEPKEVVSAVVRLAQMNNVQGDNPMNLMNNISKFIANVQELKSMRKEIDHYGRQGITTRNIE